MRTPAIRTGLAVVASTASLFGALGASTADAATPSSGGPSTVCSAVGLPSSSQTFSAEGVFHVTVFTCADAQAAGFQQCANQTVKVPDVAHATVFYCVPLQASFGGNGQFGQTIVIDGVGGITIGSG